MRQWFYTPSPLSYEKAMKIMESHLESLFYTLNDEIIWGLQHTPVYTAGRSAKSQDLLNSKNIPLYETGRGGQYTYHGPGQLVVYCLLRLANYQNDIRLYIKTLELWVQKALSHLGCEVKPHEKHAGLWVEDKKIVSIGVRISRGVSYHGFAVNVTNDLTPFQGIVPCGLKDYGVTSLQALGFSFSCLQVWESLRNFNESLKGIPFV